MRTASQPWYREPWPWILAAGPIAVILAGVVTVWLAITSNDGLVADDYYKRGLEVNQVIQRDRKAEELGLQAEIFQGGEGAFRVMLSSTRSAALPEKVKLYLAHPAKAGFDLEITLASDGQGVYSGKLNHPITGSRWLVRLEDETGAWRLSADWVMEKQESLSMKATSSVSSSNR
jgi:hypothetical protein